MMEIMKQKLTFFLTISFFDLLRERKSPERFGRQLQDGGI